jgi:hypothetical protein
MPLNGERPMFQAIHTDACIRKYNYPAMHTNHGKDNMLHYINLNKGLSFSDMCTAVLAYISFQYSNWNQCNFILESK